ncbi:hypothetical protein EVAR_12985_1 [Eumeta japonica]|uniref:Uncharacterized protein n=1 Tax=Eumeta variegata TaxID=151549 RepID=A0A4C1TXB2_EUMVA|nr:hypothetical protein EVAR_12985_1 [Eumeta japonica]
MSQLDWPNPPEGEKYCFGPHSPPCADVRVKISNAKLWTKNRTFIAWKLRAAGRKMYNREEEQLATSQMVRRRRPCKFTPIDYLKREPPFREIYTGAT